MRTTQIPDTPNDALAIEVRLLRSSRGETQDDLSRRLDWTQTRLSRLETGVQDWTAIDIWAVAGAYDLTPGQLVGRAYKRLAHYESTANL